MARQAKAPPKPLFPIKHEFAASLDAFVHQAGMLADAVRMMLDHGGPGGKPMIGAGADALRERLAAFDMARHGDEP